MKNKIVKSLLALAMSVLMAGSLAACGGSGEEGSASSDSGQETAGDDASDAGKIRQTEERMTGRHPEKRIRSA